MKNQRDIIDIMNARLNGYDPLAETFVRETAYGIPDQLNPQGDSGQTSVWSLEIPG